MTQSTNTRYGRVLQRPATQPVYLVELEGVPTRFSTLPVRNPLGPTQTYLTGLDGAGSQITVDEGRASLANVSFGILDKGGEITRLAFLYQLANRMVTIKTGFLELSESDYVTVFTGRVLDYTLEKDNTTWQIQVVTLLKDERQDIFDAFTKLTLAAGAGDTTLTVANTAAFPSATGGVLYLKIENEVISYTGKTPTTFTGCTRGEFGTTPAAHSANAEIVNLAYLTGNPLTIALQILTSTGLGTNGSYDVLPAACGLAIPEENIDVARFEQQRDRWLGGYNFTFHEFEKVEGKKFLEEQIYTFSNSYPVINNDGQISVKVYAPPLPDGIGQTVDDDTLTGPPTFKGNVLQRYFFNEIDIQYNFDFKSGEYLARTLFEDSNSQVTFGTVKTKAMQSRGISVGPLPGQMTQAKLDNFGLRFLKRFGTPAPVLEASAFFSRRLLELGDVIPLTSAYVPNLATGKIGIDAQLMEIIEITPNYKEATQQYTLLNTGYSYGRKYGAISPTTKAPVSFPVFSAATPAQRNYCFISRKVNNTTGVMGDGSDGYYITP